MKYLLKCITLGKCKFVNASTFQHVFSLKCFKPWFSYYTSTLYELSTTKNRFSLHMTFPAHLPSIKTGFYIVGNIFLHCWNLILTQIYNYTDFIVTAMLQIERDGTYPSKAQSRKIWSCKCAPDYETVLSNFIYSCIHFIQLSGNSYQLLEFECIWKLCVDPVSF